MHTLPKICEHGNVCAVSISPSGYGSPNVSLQMGHCRTNRSSAMCSREHAAGCATGVKTRLVQAILNRRSIFCMGRDGEDSLQGAELQPSYI